MAETSKRVRVDSINDSGLCFQDSGSVEVPDVGLVSLPLIKGDLAKIPLKIQQFVAEYVSTCKPKYVYFCDGSEEEAKELTDKLVERGTLEPLKGMDNCFVCRTDPADVARVESKTFTITREKFTSVPHTAPDVKGILGQWMSPEKVDEELKTRLPGCMKGRIMYVLPFSMGPVGGPLSKVGVQLTDSTYVVLSMRIMTRMTGDVWPVIASSDEFVRCVHSVGAPRNMTRKVINHWPCNPEKTIITQFPDEKKIISYGSGYGGNSLLGKKCFALRIASCLAREEGWMAEHMLIMSVTDPKGRERFIAAAFPSACGKTNMAMLAPTLPGWKVQCIGDDIAWMRFDKDGRLRAINPEAGFFGVAPGTNNKTNPIAMATCSRNTIFTNVAITKDGQAYWEGLEKEVSDPEMEISGWLGHKKTISQYKEAGLKAAHPNSRFCTPAAQCPIIHPKWQDPEGVPIDAIVFGGRRPEGVPLVFEAFDWEHGVMLGAALKSESTAAAEHKGKTIMHDPMAMRPFLGYNFGDYLRHWLNVNKPSRQMPKVFHVNWFRLDDEGKFVWPGFGENIRVVDWMLKRLDGEENTGVESPIGILPKEGSLDLKGLDNISWDKMFSLPKDYWLEDVKETRTFFEQQVGIDLPAPVSKQLDQLEERIMQIS